METTLSFTEMKTTPSPFLENGNFGSGRIRQDFVVEEILMAEKLKEDTRSENISSENELSI